MAPSQDKDAASPPSNGRVHVASADNKQPKSSPSAFAIFLLLIPSLVIGTLLGACLTSHLLETEYQSILSDARASHQISLNAAKTDVKSCSDEIIQLNKEKDTISAEKDAQVCLESLKKLQSQFTVYEKSCQQEILELYQEANASYERANHALSSASEKSKTLKSEYTTLERKYFAKISENESISQSLSASQRQQGETRRLVSELKNVVASMSVDMEGKEKVIRAHEEELDRRDLERMECDGLHREVLECKKKLEENGKECPSASNNWSAEKEELLMQLSTMAAEKENASQQVSELDRRNLQMQEHLSSVATRAREAEQERQSLEEERASVIERIQIRDRMFVLERYGPGPHEIEITVRIPAEPAPATESLVLRLAPLEIMPHAVKTFLELAERGTYAGGTFVLAKDHIALGGPRDMHDAENNGRLMRRLVEEGYDGGALLFNEYSDEYPHVPGTIGFVASQSGPMFYVNLKDNSEAHSALKDPCFGEFVEGFDALRRVVGMPRREDDTFELPIYIVGTRILDR